LNLFRISDFDIRILSEQEFSFKHYYSFSDIKFLLLTGLPLAP